MGITGVLLRLSKGVLAPVSALFEIVLDITFSKLSTDYK